MRIAVILFLGFLAGCTGKDERVRVAYHAALARENAAYASANAAFAYNEKLLFIDYVKKLEREGADIPYKDIYVWDYARLGLLAEHLGKKAEATRFFAMAELNAKKAYPNQPTMNSEAALRTALEQMDTPDKIPWRRK